MWIKLDDGFATHPKIITAGPLALALQVRAICYASQHRTDGFLPEAMLPYLVLGLPEQDWPKLMTETGLWDRQGDGYQIHDYLEWNCSKKDYDKWKKKLSLAGKRGMKSRWDKENLDITKVIAKVITHPVTSSSTSTATLSSPNPEGKESEKGEPKWFTGLRGNPLYAHINFTTELQRIDEWHSRPANKHRVINQRFVANWLNRIEPPLSNGASTRLTCPHHPTLTFADAHALKVHNFSYHPQYAG